MTESLVLVTGGSGFIAGHCILRLAAQGYRVRTTVRSLDRVGTVGATLAAAGLADPDAVEFVAADLLADDGWAEAVAGVEFVLHVASPVHPGAVADESSVIVPAREGALRVMRAAGAAGVRRVVLTSAFHAVAWGHPHDDHVFTEADWTVLDGPGVDAYGKSKTLAERAAWDFVAGLPDDGHGSLELTTVLPVAVMGPALGDAVSGANHIVQRLLTGGMTVTPDLWIPVVDVRDVADAHVRAMTAPEAAGERLLLAADAALPMRRIAGVLRDELGAAASKVPTRRLPTFVVRLGALRSPQLRALLPDLGYARRASSAKARRVLDWTPRPSEDAVRAAARSLAP